MIELKTKCDGIGAAKKVEQVQFNKKKKISIYILKKLKKYKNKWFEVQKIDKKIFHTYFWCPLRIVDKKFLLMM